jgi:hypothetical protein
VLLVLSNAVQNAINGGDNSVTAGVISASTLIAVNYLVGIATFKSKRIEALIEGRPQILIHNGKLFSEVMERAHLTHHELNASLRKEGCACIEDVHCDSGKQRANLGSSRKGAEGKWKAVRLFLRSPPSALLISVNLAKARFQRTEMCIGFPTRGFGRLSSRRWNGGAGRARRSLKRLRYKLPLVHFFP